MERFLSELPPGSVGLDIGCGNGKYLTVNPNVHMIGSDRYVPSSLTDYPRLATEAAALET